MTDEDGGDLSRRLHWDAGNRPARGAEDVAAAGGAPDPVVDGGGWDDEVAWPSDVAWPNSSATDRVAVRASPVVPSFERRDLARMELAALDRRRQLWRDTALLLSGLVAALLVANLVLPQIAGLAAASPSPFGTGNPVGPSPSPQEAAGPTQAPSLGPSLGIDVAPTHVPAITLPPTGTSAPSTPHPIATPKPTHRPTPPPTQAPTPAPTPTPTPTPEITPTPAPTVQIACTALPALTVSCSGTMTHEAPGSEVWDMGGSGTVVTGGNGSDSITFIYDAEGTYHVVLSITGLDGSSKSDGTDVTVSAL